MNGFAKPSTFVQNLKSILLYKIVATLRDYPRQSVSTVQYELVCFFANPVISQLKAWHLWKAPIEWP